MRSFVRSFMYIYIHDPLLPCPGFILSSKTVLICLREFYLVSGVIDENLTHA